MLTMPTELAELLAAVKQKGYPVALYKYRSLAPGAPRERAIEMLRFNRVFYSAIADFNDPFECRIILSFDADRRKKRTYYQNYLVRQESFSLSGARALANKCFGAASETTIRDWEAKRGPQLNAWLTEGTGVYCTSEAPDDILMWSHYADQHKGICVELRPARESHLRFWATQLKVAYAAKVPSINMYTDFADDRVIETVRKALLTKALHWAHEREHRDILSKEGPCQVSLPEGIISAVIMGCRISDEDRAFLRQLAAERGFELRQARQKHGHYTLEILPDNPGS